MTPLERAQTVCYMNDEQASKLIFCWAKSGAIKTREFFLLNKLIHSFCTREKLIEYYYNMRTGEIK
jgi:hypothetical protein